MERRGAATHTRNSPAALSNKKRQKKNRKGCYTFTVYRYFSSNMQRFDFYLLGAKPPCTEKDFFNGLHAHPLYGICKQKSLLAGNKNPSKLQKSEIGEISKHGKSAHRNIVFFIRWACPIYGYIKNRADKLVIAHLFIGSASNVSGSLCYWDYASIFNLLISRICKFFASINVSCLHFGQ